MNDGCTFPAFIKENRDENIDAILLKRRDLCSKHVPPSTLTKNVKESIIEYFQNLFIQLNQLWPKINVWMGKRFELASNSLLNRAATIKQICSEGPFTSRGCVVLCSHNRSEVYPIASRLFDNIRYKTNVFYGTANILLYSARSRLGVHILQA